MNRQGYRKKMGSRKPASRTMRGRGAYSMAQFRSDAAGLGKIIGRPILDAAQNAVVKGIKTISGTGMYSGRGAYNNLFPKQGRSSMSVRSSNDEKQTITISNCEYLQDVYGPATANFSNNTISLNPGLSENFPFIAQLAANYEEYEFVQLVFNYRSTVDPSATNNATGATGTVILATNYDPTAPSFTNKETMMNYHGAMSGRLTEDHIHGVECEPFANQGTPIKYTRSLPLAGSTQSLSNYDWGTFQFAFVNTPSAFFNQQIGELWVTYTVKLSKPKLYSALGNNALEYRAVTSGGETFLQPWGTNLLTMVKTGLQCLPIIPDSTGSIVLNGPASSTGAVNTSTYSNSQTTNGKQFYMITLPDFLSGVIEVQLLIEGTDLVIPSSQSPVATSSTSVAGVPAAPVFQNYVLKGSNVQPWSDILASATTATSDTPTFICVATNVAKTQSILIARFSVQPVTAGIDNIIGFELSYTGITAVVTQVSLKIAQVTGALATSASVPLPLYANASGTITSPF